MNHETARNILGKIQYATVATTSGTGIPWNTPVFFAYDKQGNMYWSSHPGTVHSQNIADNGKAFIVIYDSVASTGKGLGLYAASNVNMVEDEQEIETALSLLGARRGKPFEHSEKFSLEGSQRIYKAVPTKWWTNDAIKDEDGDFIKDYRIEIKPFKSAL